MAPELGQFALVLALVLAILQAFSGLVGPWRNQAGLIRLARPATYAQFLALAVAFGCLTYCFLTTDLSVKYVVDNSNVTIPLVYKFAGVWGAHAGSVLLWTLIMGVWGAAVATFSRRLPRPFLARVLGVMGALAVGFLIYSLWMSNPFTRLLPPAASGADLNPILQDPMLATHPPTLYMGYVGFSVAFAFSVAALIGGRMDSAWARWTRPWTLAAWLFLTAGITLGSYWSYFELGWGGWWFWDPVENASFMPWLVGTALVHSLMVTEKRGAFRGWTALLALLAFTLSLFGTFLVRSGVLVSVHAFAVNPERGIYVLALLGIFTGAGLALYAWRAPRLASGGGFDLFSRETALLTMNVILVVAAAAVLLGTLYPLFYSAAGLGRLSIGPPYFNRVFIPVMVPLLLLIGLGPSIRWRRGDWHELWRRVRLQLGLALSLAIALSIALWRNVSPLDLAAIALGLWVVVSAWGEIVRRLWRSPSGDRIRFTRGVWGMTLAHFGMGITILGIAVSSALSSHLNVSLQPGQHASVGGYRFSFTDVRHVTGPNYQGDQGTFRITHNGNQVATLNPEHRTYVGNQPTSESAIFWEPLQDIYVAMGQATGDGGWSFRLQVRPLVRFIWGGAILMALGGLLALTDSRYRRRHEARLPAGNGVGSG
ncbi:MAG: heme lyase CcmF/NrfE family subunit [Gammaproteobacteria bacterium]